jgi:hypothetical protein
MQSTFPLFVRRRDIAEISHVQDNVLAKLSFEIGLYCIEKLKNLIYLIKKVLYNRVLKSLKGMTAC